MRRERASRRCSAHFGWWPVDDWVYRGGLVIEFRHGIVEAGPRPAI